MNFDHELKQRLIGALVVTILSAIFIPMLFDDQIEEEGQAVTTLVLPSESQFVEEPAVKAPETSEQVLEIPKQPQVEVAALAPSTTPVAKNTLRPDEMEDAPPPPKSQSKSTPKPKVEKTAVYSETTNYGVKPPEEIDDEPPMKQKVDVKKSDKNEDALLKQIRAAKLLDDANATKITSVPAPVSVSTDDKKKTSRWFIQVASLTNKAKAEALQEGLKAQGLPVMLSQLQTEKGTFYRLRVGPELDGKRAAAMKKKMDDQGVTSMLISE
jgi:DedD protein